jgi:outer membrane protein assembly factor BamB
MQQKSRVYRGHFTVAGQSQPGKCAAPADQPAVGRRGNRQLAGWQLACGKVATWLAAVVMTLGGGMFVAAASAADWTLARGDASGTGRSAESLPDELKLLWEYPAGGAGFEGTPIIAEGSVYLADVDGRVFALDFETGQLRWQRELDTGFIAAGAFHAGRFYIGDYDGKLHALNAADGSDLWQFETQGQIDAGATFINGKLLITSEDGTLYCLEEETGKLVWKYETGDQLRCGASLAGDRTFLAGCDGRLHIVNVTEGKSVREPLPLEGPTGSTPSVEGEVVYVPTHAGDLFAFNVRTGEQLWKVRDPKLAQEFQNAVAVADGLVVASSRNRRVFALDAKTGEVRWDVVLRKRADSSPVIAGDKVVISATDGRLLLLDLKSGRELWMTEVKGGFIASPAVAAGKLIVASDKGTVYCFGKP